jgi:hypothetical protein
MSRMDFAKCVHWFSIDDEFYLNSKEAQSGLAEGIEPKEGSN